MKKYNLHTLVHIKTTGDITEEELKRVIAKWGTIENACNAYSDHIKETLLTEIAGNETHLLVVDVSTGLSEEDTQ